MPVITLPRGVRPQRFACDIRDADWLARHVPGVAQIASGVECTEDVAPAIGAILQQPAPELPDEPVVRRYKDLIPEDAPRDYQTVAGNWLAPRGWAMLCDPMRAGKCLEFLLGYERSPAKRVLIVCPAIARWGWAREIAKWTKKAALLLEGLSCDRAKVFCLTCHYTGVGPDGKHCPDCKARNGQSYGYKILEVRSTEEPTATRRKKWFDTTWRCRKHPTFIGPPNEPVKCELCVQELMTALRTAEFTITNYELLTPQSRRDAAGKAYVDERFRGWGAPLRALLYDLVGIDEAHTLRAVPTRRKIGKMMADRVRSVAADAVQVWAITGTPIYGYIRDLHPVLNVISDGMFDDEPYKFHARYCAGKFNESNYWESTGRSNEAELIRRLDYCMLKRERSEILKDMPKKQREVILIDPPVGFSPKHKANGTPAGNIKKIVEQVARFKRPQVVANVMSELSEGLKTVVLTFHRSTCERLGKAIEAEMQKREYRGRMRAVNAECWMGQTTKGINSTNRDKMATKFVAHQGAGVFVATIDSLRDGGISLAGATSVHMTDFHSSPSAMEQAEDRPNAVGIMQGLMIYHYVVKGTIDQHYESVLMPKFRVKDELLNDENAKNVISAFGPGDEKETVDAVWARHCAALEDDDDDE